MLSGAIIAFAAVLLIIPGFVTDFIGFLLIFPVTRKLLFNYFAKKFQSKQKKEDKKRKEQNNLGNTRYKRSPNTQTWYRINIKD